MVQDLTGCMSWIPEVCPKMCFCLAVKLCLGLRNILWYCTSLQRRLYSSKWVVSLFSFSSFIWVNFCLLNWILAWNVPEFLIGKIQRSEENKGQRTEKHIQLQDMFFLAWGRKACKYLLALFFRSLFQRVSIDRCSSNSHWCYYCLLSCLPSNSWVKR